MEQHDIPTERHLADALRRLKSAAVVPPPDPAREAALMAAFDAARASGGRGESKGRRDRLFLAAFAAAAAVVIAVGIGPALAGRRGTPPGAQAAPRPPVAARDVRLEPPNDFVLVPGAAGLPALESGTLVRMDVPAALLPSYGVTPPAGRGTVTADFIVAQDGLPRAVRLVSP